jgi:hypothetical protein
MGIFSRWRGVKEKWKIEEESNVSAHFTDCLGKWPQNIRKINCLYYCNWQWASHLHILLVTYCYLMVSPRTSSFIHRHLSHSSCGLEIWVSLSWCPWLRSLMGLQSCSWQGRHLASSLNWGVCFQLTHVVLTGLHPLPRGPLHTAASIIFLQATQERMKEYIRWSSLCKHSHFYKSMSHVTYPPELCHFGS